MDYIRSRIICKLLLSLPLLFANLALTGCVDLAAPPKNLQAQQLVPRIKGSVYCMRGGLGGIFSTGMNQLQKTLQRDYKIRTTSIIWYKTNQLSNEIIKDLKAGKIQKPIVLVGHSLGANEQIKVARNLWRANIPVALIITVDAVSPMTVPPNVNYALNLYTPSFVPMFSGLQIKAMDPQSTRIENLNVKRVKNVHVNHFTIDKDKDIQRLMLQTILTALGVTKQHQQRGSL